MHVHTRHPRSIVVVVVVASEIQKARGLAYAKQTCRACLRFNDDWTKRAVHGAPVRLTSYFVFIELPGNLTARGNSSHFIRSSLLSFTYARGIGIRRAPGPSDIDPATSASLRRPLNGPYFPGWSSSPLPLSTYSVSCEADRFWKIKRWLLVSCAYTILVLSKDTRVISFTSEIICKI